MQMYQLEVVTVHQVVRLTGSKYLWTLFMSINKDILPKDNVANDNDKDMLCESCGYVIKDKLIHDACHCSYTNTEKCVI
jgi:hypothetical protein